jgi:hypothetical protein
MRTVLCDRSAKEQMAPVEGLHDLHHSGANHLRRPRSRARAREDGPVVVRTLLLRVGPRQKPKRLIWRPEAAAVVRAAQASAMMPLVPVHRL